MNTSPDSTNPADTRPLDPDPTGQDPSATDPTAKGKMLLQSVIFEVTREAGGRSLPEIRDMLQAGFARRGVEAPTNIWLDSVASAAFYGEPYIIDLPQPWQQNRLCRHPMTRYGSAWLRAGNCGRKSCPPGHFLPAQPGSWMTTRSPGERRRPAGRTPVPRWEAEAGCGGCWPPPRQVRPSSWASRQSGQRRPHGAGIPDDRLRRVPDDGVVAGVDAGHPVLADTQVSSRDDVRLAWER